METGHCVFDTIERKVVHSILKQKFILLKIFLEIFFREMGQIRPRRWGYKRMAGPLPGIYKNAFFGKGGVKTTKVNDYKTSDRRVVKGNHNIPNHQWCSTECFREQRIRAFE